MRLRCVPACGERVYAEVQCFAESGSPIADSVALKLAQLWAEPGSPLALVAAGAEFDPAAVSVPGGDTFDDGVQLAALSGWLLGQVVKARRAAKLELSGAR
ncbi:hypothetical protein OG563_26615 [Nocardia vinacea]|uniref:Uncharacterized protein n=1 Tax=Nocardia vinacea TaxID=96468 RepID=A0ABZ1YHW8_9NOCA|nr:hypothetical protein [Nocardia vinacea]